MLLEKIRLDVHKFKDASWSKDNALLLILSIWLDLIFIYAIILVFEEKSKAALLLLFPILWIYNGLKRLFYGIDLPKPQHMFLSGFLSGHSTNAKQIINTGDPRDINIIKVHEAGHAVMAEILGIGIKEISLETLGNSGGRVILDLPGVQMAKELKNMVIINYSGLVAEMLILGGVSTGSIGSENSDIERSNLALRHFIILMDNEISITGYEEEYIKSKSIELSKDWMAEAKSLLETNKQKLVDKVKSL